MVAWLPSHVLLFLILVTGIQPKRTYGNENPKSQISVGLKSTYNTRSRSDTLSDNLKKIHSTDNRSAQPYLDDQYIEKSNSVSWIDRETNVIKNNNAVLRKTKNEINKDSVTSEIQHSSKKLIQLKSLRPEKDSQKIQNTSWNLTDSLKVKKFTRSSQEVVEEDSNSSSRIVFPHVDTKVNDSSGIGPNLKIKTFKKNNDIIVHSSIDPLVVPERTKLDSIKFILSRPIEENKDSSIESIQLKIKAKDNIKSSDSNKDTFSTINEIKKQPKINIYNQIEKKDFQILSSINNANLHNNNNKLSSQYHEKVVRSTDIAFPRRYMRDIPKNACEKFENDETNKNEFYSPNYPQNYPPSVDCVKVLEADEGMLLKLDFRDVFELESKAPVNEKDTECRFDYLEVRDGKYGFSTLIKTYCGSNFPPEIISKSRYLWLHFHSDDTIEYRGFKAVWTMVPRPTNQGVSTEQDHCFIAVQCDAQSIISSEDAKEEKKKAEKNSVAFDCLWAITAKDGWRMQLTFDTFKLDKPNDCDANFLDVFGERTDMPSRLKNFCGSIAEQVVTKTNTMYIRFYLEPKALNSSFELYITAVRDKESNDKPCRPDEYDCDDATCIASHLRCNNRDNCRLRWDEDVSICGNTKGSLALDSTRIVIILVIFSMIMFGMIFALGFNCIRKLIRDHRIIREHIRQSQENRLDEIGRGGLSCPLSLSQNDICQQICESPPQECSHKEIISEITLVPQEYRKELVLEMNYNQEEVNDIHQCNNVKNATQERLQETSDEPDMCDNSCQTRESLFNPRSDNSDDISPYDEQNISRNSSNTPRRSRTGSYPKEPGSYSKNSFYHSNSIPAPAAVQDQCPRCRLALREANNSSSRIPAPAGWSVHNSSNSPEHCNDYFGVNNDEPYKGHHILQPEVESDVRYGNICRKPIIGSGERYDSFLYDSGQKTSSTTMSSNCHNNSDTTRNYQIIPNSRHRAEAVIDVDSNRPFSIESTKSAPDVIATH